MSTFNFRNKKTGELKLVEGMIADAEAFEKANPDWDWLAGMPLIHSGSGMKKPDQGFRDVLRTIKKGNSKGMHGSTVNTF